MEISITNWHEDFFNKNKNYFATILDASRTPCDSNDEECITSSFNETLPAIAAGIPTLGVKPSDPLKMEIIIGVLPKLTYIFRNAVMTGYKDCIVTNAL